MSNPAQTYESYMVPVLFAPIAQLLLDIIQPMPGTRVLDVASGTGVVARQVAARLGTTGSVTGIDLNPHMLEVAREMSAREGLSIEWHEGRAESLPMQDESFDLVLCQQALQFFTDREAALAEMFRVLAEDGRVAVSAWQGIEHHPFYQMLDDVIQHHLGMSGVGDIFKLGDAEELRALLTTAGFCDIEIAQVSITARFPDPEGFLAGEIDVDTAAIPAWQHLSTQERQDLTATIRTDMEVPLREVTEGDHVVLPFYTHIATAER